MIDIDVIARHYDHYLRSAPTLAEHIEGVDIALYPPSEDTSFCTAATLGLSRSIITAVIPQEIVCSVRAGQEGAAVALAKLATQLVLSGGRGLVDEDVIPSDSPLLNDTEIYGLLTGAHPYMPEAFNLIFDTSGKAVLNFVTVVPVLQSEIFIAQAGGVEKLIDLLEERSPDLCDVTRVAG